MRHEHYQRTRERDDACNEAADTNRVTGETHKPPNPTGKTRPTGDGISLLTFRDILAKVTATERAEVWIGIKKGKGDYEFHKITAVETLDTSSVMIVGD